MIHLRPATPADADALFALWHRAVTATHDFLSAGDRQAIAADVAAMLPAGAATPALTVATDAAGTPTGFMIMDGAHMEALFIDPAHHGQGIGRALVAHAVARHGPLTTDVNEQNPAALAFYRRIGFHPTGRSATDGQGRPFPIIHLAQA
jgi:putative acetyltransferase